MSGGWPSRPTKASFSNRRPAHGSKRPHESTAGTGPLGIRTVSPASPSLLLGREAQVSEHGLRQPYLAPVGPRIRLR
jgi:hypothetical protein